MITSRTALRVSFVGGGTDYPGWYTEHGGAVLATSIDKYCYVSLHNGKVTKWFDLPERAGLGTSSAFTVGLLRVCTELDQRMIANLATSWEQDKLGGNIGVQDQYICSVGGFRILRISEAGIRDTLIEDAEWMNDYLMLFNTHQYRMAGKVVANQLKEMKRHEKAYFRMLDMVDESLKIIKDKDYQGFGELLGEAWNLKKQLSRYISTRSIDDIYDKAIQSGAIGGKLLGAGGGGFMLFIAPTDKQEQVKQSLTNCEYVPFKFETTGTQIIFKDKI